MMHGRSVSPIALLGMLVLILLAGCAGFPIGSRPTPPAPAEVRAPAPSLHQTISFQSLTLPGTLWSPLLPPSSAGEPVTISGILTIPAGSGLMPAVVITHGCTGISAAQFAWARQLNDLGIATLMVQSFAGRAIGELCSGRSSLNIAGVIVDAYRALDVLATHPRIDPERIAILGFSFGGRTALWTNQIRIHERYGTPGRTFAAHLAFYPTGCFMQLAGEEQGTAAPIRIFHGAADDWTPLDQCAAYIERLRQSGNDAAIFAYPDALHGFDNSYATGTFTIPAAVSPRNCTFVERDGQMIDLATGGEASLDSACVVRGVTVGYNAAAHEQSIRDVEAFLRSVFGLP